MEATEPSRAEAAAVVPPSSPTPPTPPTPVLVSTTESAAYLLSMLGIQAKPVLRWGPLGMQQISEARRRQFCVMGFAGNSAPDHVDHLQALPFFLKRMMR